MKYLFITVCIWNVAVFLVYAFDKLFAIRQKRRISEKTLITLAFLFGSVGAFLGMYVFRHKTRKLKFQILVPLALISNALIIFFCINGNYIEFTKNLLK